MSTPCAAALARGGEKYYNSLTVAYGGRMPARCPVEGSFLYDKLLAFGEENVLPMHMPGHKRDTERFPWLKPLG